MDTGRGPGASARSSNITGSESPSAGTCTGLALITKQPQPGSVRDKEYIPAFRWHIERLQAPRWPEPAVRTMLASRLNGLPTGMLSGHWPFR